MLPEGGVLANFVDGVGGELIPAENECVNQRRLVEGIQRMRAPGLDARVNRRPQLLQRICRVYIEQQPRRVRRSRFLGIVSALAAGLTVATNLSSAAERSAGVLPSRFAVPKGGPAGSPSAPVGSGASWARLLLPGAASIPRIKLNAIRIRTLEMKNTRLILASQSVRLKPAVPQRPDSSA